jgi:hypothetical protein
LRSHLSEEATGRSSPPTDVCRDCRDIRTARETSVAAIHAAAVQRIAARMNVETRGISIFVSAMALGLKAHLHALLRDEMIS